jgi:ribosome-binding protein aMBF1 (putative translation factor)
MNVARACRTPLQDATPFTIDVVVLQEQAVEHLVTFNTADFAAVSFLSLIAPDSLSKAPQNYVSLSWSVVIKNENIWNVPRSISNATPSSLRSPRRSSRKLKSAAAQSLFDRYVGKDAERIEEYEQEVINARIAREIYDLRTKAGLSQRQLAARVGTSASAICRLEDADYEGHSLALLKRIAAALGTRVEIRFVTPKRARRS